MKLISKNGCYYYWQFREQYNLIIKLFNHLNFKGQDDVCLNIFIYFNKTVDFCYWILCYVMLCYVWLFVYALFTHY